MCELLMSIKGFSAFITYVGFSSSVNSVMLMDGWTPPKLPTIIIFIGLFSNMNSFTPAQARIIAEGFASESFYL